MNWSRFLRFLCVGGVATVLQYLILIALVSNFHFTATFASTIGYSLSTLFNYVANRRLTFQTTRSHTSALPRFLIVAICGLTINSITIWLFAEYWSLHYLVAQIFASCLALCWNYLASHRWAFASTANYS